MSELEWSCPEQAADYVRLERTIDEHFTAARRLYVHGFISESVYGAAKIRIRKRRERDLTALMHKEYPQEANDDR